MSLGTDGDRFWSKVDKGPDCWLWTASTFKSGRGQFRVGVRNRQAHLVAWELTFRAPPLGLLRSRCGNLLCVRPDHQVPADRMVGAKGLWPKSLSTRAACRIGRPRMARHLGRHAQAQTFGHRP